MVSETICPECGERNARGTEFCSACGAFLAWDGDQDAPPDPRPAGPAPSAVAPQSPAPQGPAGPPAMTPARPQSTPASAQSTPAGQQPPGPAGPPAAGQSWRPTQPVVAAGQQIAGQSAASAFNAAAPALGAAVPGVLSAGAIAQSAGVQAPGWQGAGWQGAGWGAAGQGQPPQVGPQSQGPEQAPPQPPPPTEGPCPRCGVVNGAALRFCGKCGLALKGPTLHGDGLGARPQSPPERVPWWRRWFQPGDNTRRAARAAYRHSLPVRVRLIRWGLAVLGIGAIVGTLALIGQNPVGWAMNNWNDLVGNTSQVQGVDAFTEPPPAASAGTVEPAGPSTAAPASGSSVNPPPDTAPNLVDNLSDTAWTTNWTAELNQPPAEVSCETPAPEGASSVLLVPPGSVTLKKISVAAGLPESDSRRMLQWRPKTIQLSYSDGRCEQIVLDDIPDLQEKDLETVDTSQVLLSIIDTYPPATDQPVNSLSVTELRLFERG